MNLFNLYAKLTLDKDEYDKGIDDAKKEGTDYADHVNKKVSPAAVAGWAAIAAAVVAIIKKIADLAKASIDYADKVSDLAAQYGLATESIQEMQYIADQSSTSVEGLASAMTMLLNRAKEEGEVFQQLGISVKDANGNYKQMDELFYETVGALNNIENEGERSAKMLEVFGRSAMSVGEVVRKSSKELNAMRQEAHDLGVILKRDTIQAASDFNDTLASLKLQGKSALAAILADEDGAEEKFQAFLDRLLEIAEKYLPLFVDFAVRLILQIGVAWQRISPKISNVIIDAFIDMIFETDWFEVGKEMGKSMAEGILNMITTPLRKVLDFFGVDMPEFDFTSEDRDFTTSTLKSYEITENSKQDITLKIEASGDTALSQETAEKTAEAIAPYIDKILGGK